MRAGSWLPQVCVAVRAVVFRADRDPDGAEMEAVASVYAGRMF